MSEGRQTYLNLALALGIVGIGGCIAIYSARAYDPQPLYYALRQLCWLAGSVAVFLAVTRIDFSFFRKHALILAGAAAVLLTAVMLFGTQVNHMRGWFRITETIYFQPSEFAKPFFLLLLSAAAAKTQWSEFKRFAAAAGTGILFCGLVALEPDMGSAAVFAAGLILVLAAGGFRWRYPLAVFLAGNLGAAAFIFRHTYALARIRGFLNPGTYLETTGWHVRQFQYTLAHGGIFGSESGTAVWSNTYLPLSHSDSAFASIVEATGLVGGLVVIAGFAVLLFLMRRMALKASDPCARIYIFSAGALCAFQALLHISVNVALVPATGLTLPVFSYGGSSLMATMLMLGIACSAAAGNDP